MVVLGILVSIIMIPNSLNNSKRSKRKISSYIDEEDDSQGEESSELKDQSSSSSFEYEELTYWAVLSNIECLVCLVSCCLAVMFTLYIDCILALHLNKHFQISHSWIGVFFLLSSVTYVIGAPLSSFLSNYVHRRYIAFGAFALMILENILEGPSTLFGLDDSIVYIVTGVTLLGFCLSMALVPLLSELISTLENYQIYDPIQISNVTASLFNVMFNLGNLMAPIVAGVLNDNFGYQSATDFMAVACIFYCAIFYYFMIFRKDLSVV